jgi:hypothetical protein
MSELFEAARPLLARLAATLESQPDLRSDLAAFARATAQFLDGSGMSSGSVLTPPPASNYSPAPRPVTPAAPFAPPAFRYSPPFEGGPGPGGFEPEREQVPLPIMAKRCRVKAEACRLLAKRYAGATPEPDESMPLFKKAAELPDCGLWMLTGSGFNTAPAVWENLAGALEAAAVACELLDKVLPRNDSGLEIGLNLAAESQSTLLYAVVDTGRRGPDTDQIELFIRIRETGAQRRIYIPKYLKRDDRADPDNWKDVLARLQREYEVYKNGSGGTTAPDGTKLKAPDKTKHSLAYHLKKAKESPVAADWDWIFKLIDEAVTAGLPAGDPELRELLLPVIDRAPDDIPEPAGVRRVFQDLDRYLAARPTEERLAPETPSQELVKAAVLLGGKDVAVVGGLPRPTHQKALVEAFDLRNVRWLPTPDEGSLARIEADLARPEIALVLHATRYSAVPEDDLRAACEKANKPYVRIGRGYGPNHVASDILRQAGEKLRGG